MQVEITGRQMDVTPALKEYVKSRVAKVEKYVHRDYGIRVVLEVDKLRHIAEIIVNLKGSRITAREEGEQMYASVDKAMDKVEQQLRRYKGKHTNHKGAPKLVEDSMEPEDTESVTAPEG